MTHLRGEKRCMIHPECRYLCGGKEIKTKLQKFQSNTTYQGNKVPVTCVSVCTGAEKTAQCPPCQLSRKGLVWTEGSPEFCPGLVFHTYYFKCIITNAFQIIKLDCALQYILPNVFIDKSHKIIV